MIAVCASESVPGTIVAVSTRATSHTVRTGGCDTPARTWCGRTVDDTWHVVMWASDASAGPCIRCVDAWSTWHARTRPRYVPVRHV